MIVKNGEILAIDHIAHDNTLSGNGTSAKPVGLSQSTKDLIDSKVKKTDFETYKSSAANQISNINTKITTDESNFESYKSSAHNEIANFKSSAHDEIARVDASIAAVNAAKVSNTTFEQYQTAVANDFTAVNKRIDDVDAVKQNKGDYVSASNFNSYKSSAHNEIARIDGRIDATNTNLDNNYYDITETYNKTEVDEKFANFGGFKFRDPDPTKDNEPKWAPEEVIDPKAIYLTQPAGATQYLQWIWNTEVTPNAWKCIGDTTMDLSDYAKTVDVVQSANNNVQAVKDWADDKFETKQDFESVIAGYYTKSEVNTELATKVDNDDFDAYKSEVNSKFTNTSAWANEKFATKQNLTDTKAELEDTIESISGEIISKVNTDYGTLDGKIADIATTLSNDYYTSLEIDAILAASGEYYTKTESDTKYVEKSVFETAINELNSNKLDKSATANWDVTEYTEGENIKIVGHEISGKDWSNEIADAVKNKVDESELENYYTSNQIDNKFVTNDKFNDLDNDVDVIVTDLNILSGKTVTVIKDSETVKAIRSTELDGTISYTLSAHDGKQADYLWKPTVNAAGDISWELALTGDTPTTANIKGSNGDNGKTPELTSENYHIKWKYTDESIWNDLGDFRGASGTNGKDGKDGKDGINGTSAFVRINDSTNYWEISNDNATWSSTNIFATGPKGDTGDDGVSLTVVLSEAVTSELHKNGGTTIKITDKTSDQTFTAWNGNDGTMAGAPGITGYDGITARNTGTTYEIGLSSEFYTAITSVSSKLDKSEATSTYATKDALDVYLTKNDAAKSYQPKGDYLSANALNGYATEQYVQGANAEVTAWVNSQGYLKSVPEGYATETWVNNQGFLKSVPDNYALKSDIPTIPDITATNGISADGHNISLTESVYSAIQEISAANDLVGANGISVVAGANNQVIIAPSGISPSKQYAMTTTGWEEVQAGTTETAYVPLSGGTMSGQLTISGDSFNNNLHLKRDNNEGFIGLAGNGAITLKNSTNGSTSQIEFLTSDNKTFDITVKDNSTTPQPVGKLYVMSAHSLADATATSANWANDGMLHIILDS